jgi:aspartate-semialdehyde dehydrogenase
VSDQLSQEWVSVAAEEGAWVIDNSACYRLDGQTQLIVPEVNGEELSERLEIKKQFSSRERVISGPNCSAAPLALLLKPVEDAFGLKRVVVSTYQSVSGAGQKAIEELKSQSADFLAGKKPTPVQFSHQIAFNCIPAIGRFQEDGYTSEESKIIAESRKILGLPDLPMTATAIRVPTINCHAGSVNIETKRAFDLSQVKQALMSFPGVRVFDQVDQKIYPMNVTGTGEDHVFVGRIRRDMSLENGMNLWFVSDNLRKGAALNAVQIAEIIRQVL